MKITIRDRIKDVLNDLPSMEMAQKIYESVWAEKPLWNAMLHITSRVYDLPLLLPLAPRRCDVLIIPRSHMVRLLYVFDLNTTLTKLAHATNRAEHTSVLNLLKIFDEQIAMNRNYESAHSLILKELHYAYPDLINTNVYTVYANRTRTKTRELIYNHDEFKMLHNIQMGSGLVRNVGESSISDFRKDDSTGAFAGSSVPA